MTKIPPGYRVMIDPDRPREIETAVAGYSFAEISGTYAGNIIGTADLERQERYDTLMKRYRAHALAPDSPEMMKLHTKVTKRIAEERGETYIGRDLDHDMPNLYQKVKDERDPGLGFKIVLLFALLALLSLVW